MASNLPSTMRASQWTTTSGGIEKNLTFNPKAPLPKNSHSLPKDSALIKVAYSTLNPVDYKLAEMPIVSSLLFSKPAIPCIDFAGTIVETTIPELQPGDRVGGRSAPPAFGALGEYLVNFGKQDIIKLPDEVSFEQAAGIGVCGLTAYQCIVPYVKEGDKVFINGGSAGTGTFGIQIAKAIGCRVTTTCSGSNVELCKSLGADEVIDYRTTDVVEHLKRQGTQYDLLVDMVNVPAIYWSAEHYLKPKGKFVTIAGDIDFLNIISLAKMFLLPTMFGGGKRTPKFLFVAASAEEYTRILQWMKEGKVKTCIEKEFELEQAAEAFAHLKTGRTRGKLLVKVAGD